MRMYVKDEARGFYRLDEIQAFAYSDGDKEEDEIFAAIRASTDCSVYSHQLSCCIHDWPSRYHLSARRSSLLWPFRDFFKDKSVLEVGSGCGAMTRTLAEFGARVLALEGSPRRAGITSARCRDIDSVEVYCDNFDGFQVDRKFDVVTLIGVLEYAQAFMTGKDPYVAMLKKARNFLRPGGTLVLAIENRLGLKYFNGNPEDHTGLIFGGLQDVYLGSRIRTFGRRELEEMLHAAGFSQSSFHLPFPDYKFPSLIVHPDVENAKGINIADFIIGNAVGPVAAQRAGSFYDECAWRSLEKNGMVADLANSFLVFAGGAEVLPTGSLLSRVSPERRGETFSGTSVIKRKGACFVRKYGSFTCPVDRPDQELPFVDGKLYIRRVFDSFKVGCQVEKAVEAFRPWVEFLREHACQRGDTYMLPDAYFDCTPWNLLETDAGFVFFDRESLASRISFYYVVFRGILNSLSMLRFVHSPVPVSLLSLMRRIWIGLFGNDSQWQETAFLKREYDMLSRVRTGVPPSLDEYVKMVRTANLLPFEHDSIRANADDAVEQCYRKLEQDYRKLVQLKDETVRLLCEEQSARGRLVADYGKLEGQLKGAKAELASERGAREALAADYGKLEKLFTESKIEVARLNKACDEWAYGKQQSDLSCADLKRQLAELKSSPSWRVTAPLRFTKRVLRQVVSRIEAFTSQIALRVRLRRLTRSLRGCEIVFDHNLGGGANDYRKNYIRDKVSSGVPCVLVHNNLWYYENRDFSVWVFVPECVEGTEWKFATWRKCRRFLADLDVSRIVYNNLVYNPETAEIVKWIGRQRAKLLLMIHDFYPVCQYYLMTKNGRYCEGKGCDSCAKDQGDSRHLFGRIRTAAEWKSLWAPLFKRTEEIRVFSPFAIEVLESFHPGVRDRVICLPHSMDYFKGAPVELDGGAGPRIGVVGSIYSVAKGSAVVAELAESLPGDEKLVVIGTYAGVPHDRIVVTGRYEPKDIPKLLREHGINIVLFPSVCPETFSYTVSELMLLRVPVLAFDVGAQGCKIREYDRGKIVAEQDPRSILAAADELYHRVYGGEK